jgi:hypothetical protein
MPEAGFRPEPRAADQSFWHRALQPARDTTRLVRVHPLLGLILALGLCQISVFDGLSIFRSGKYTGLRRYYVAHQWGEWCHIEP